MLTLTARNWKFGTLALLAHCAFGAAAPAVPDGSLSAQDVLAKIEKPRGSPTGSTVRLDDPDIAKSAMTDYDLFARGISKVRASRASRLIIPRRSYNINLPDNALPGASFIDFSDLNDLSVEGNGALLSFFGINAKAAILIRNGHRLHVHGITVDWRSPLAFPGTVRQEIDPANRKTGYILTIDNAYPIDASKAPALTTLFQFDSGAFRYFSSTRANYDRMLGCLDDTGRCPTYLGDQRFLLPPDPDYSWIPAGAPVVATVRGYSTGVLIDGGSSNITLSDIAIYASPSSGITVINAGAGFHLQRISIDRKPDALLGSGEARRRISTDSDALDFIGTGGNILIEDSDIGFPADDGINIRGKTDSASQLPDDPRRFAIAESYPDAFKPGDAVSVINAVTFETIARAHITKADQPSNGTMGVQLDVSPRIPAQTPIFIESDRLDSRDFVIRNCHFHDAKNRGILVRGGRGLIENNWITGTTSSGIQLAAEAGSAAAEGPTIDDVIVRHNRIADTNRADFSFAPGTQKLPAAVMVYATNGRGYADPVNRHIRIEDNDISDVPWTGIFIASSDDASVAGNKLRRVNLENYGKTRYPAAGIYVMQSRHVHIGGNDAVDGVVADKATTSDVVVSNDR